MSAPKPPPADSAWGKFQKWLPVAGTVLGLIGSAAGIYSQILLDRQQIELNEQKAAAAALESQVKLLAAKRDDRKLDYEIAIKIYDKIVATDQQDSNSLRLAVALVEVLPDGGFKARLGSAVETLAASVAKETTDQTLRDAATEVAEVARFSAAQTELRNEIAQQAVAASLIDRIASIAEPGVGPGDTPAASDGRSDRVIPGSPKGWDYDVFWCERGDPLTDAANLQAATLAATALVSDESGRIRVRELPKAVNARPGYQISGFVIQADANKSEIAEATRVQELLSTATSDEPFVIRPNSGDPSPWYLSVFMCHP